MKFDVPTVNDFDPICIAGSSVLSYTHLGLGLLFAHVEPFIVKLLRKIIHLIQDEVLYEEVDRFARQEAQHYQRHQEFNNIVFAHGYPGLEERCEKLNRDYENFLATKSDQFCIAYIEGFESYTTQAALQSLSSGLYDHRRTARTFGDLFKWHMLEEIEHRNVAFDVYEHIYGNYLFRARMCLLAQNHMFRFVGDCVQLMSSVDIPRHGERSQITARQKVLMALNRIGIRARTMMPGYSPHKHTVPEKLSELAEYYTKHAQNIR